MRSMPPSGRSTRIGPASSSSHSPSASFISFPLFPSFPSLAGVATVATVISLDSLQASRSTGFSSTLRSTSSTLDGEGVVAGVAEGLGTAGLERGGQGLTGGSRRERRGLRGRKGETDFARAAGAGPVGAGDQSERGQDHTGHGPVVLHGFLRNRLDDSYYPRKSRTS